MVRRRCDVEKAGVPIVRSLAASDFDEICLNVTHGVCVDSGSPVNITNDAEQANLTC